MATSWSNKTKNLVSYTNKVKQALLSSSYLLRQTGFNLLLQTGDKIILTEAVGGSWPNKTKN